MFAGGCAYAYARRSDSHFVRAFVLGVLVGVGFELAMGISGARELRAGEGGTYDPVLSLVMGAFEIGMTTAMAHEFAKLVDVGFEREVRWAVAYLAVVLAALVVAWLFTRSDAFSGTWLSEPVHTERKVELGPVLATMGASVALTGVVQAKLRNWRLVATYFSYLTAWGTLYVVTYLATGLREYVVTGVANPTPWVVTVALYTIVFEVAGLMMAPLAVGCLLGVFSASTASPSTGGRGGGELGGVA